MPPFSTEDYHKLLQKILLPETKVNRLEVNVEANGPCGNNTTLAMTQNSGQEHARTQLTSNDGTMKKLEDSVQGNKSTSDNPPWTTLGAKPKRRPDKGERITGRTQRPDICDLADWPALPSRHNASSTPVLRRTKQRTTEKRGTTKEPPQQTGVNLQNRFAPLLQDHGSPSKFLDNPPPPRSRVRPANLKPQRKLTTGPENLIVGDFSVKDMKSGNDTKVLCFLEDMVSDLEERILEIVAEHPTVKNLILHIGSNDIEKQQSEKLKEDFDNLLETVSSVNAEVFISGPLPPTGRGAERFSRLFWVNKWLLTACAVRSMHSINNFSFFWDRRHLFKTNGLCLNKMGAKLFITNMFYIMRHPSVPTAKDTRPEEEPTKKEEKTQLIRNGEGGPPLPSHSLLLP
uniref:SGNH hydrolase-type esterase domain-containing protein n=1 Tax=Gasterosteus aculeatus aculeatus TaxID=481459 RepID=A0AAQ4PRI3_GASAC|nr:uncharacterized protein LOC120812889 [Gasterosteus aculeatus aculeatus]